MQTYPTRRLPPLIELVPPAATMFGAVGAAAARLGRWTLRCIERSRQRGHLAQLDDRLLQDIGVTRAEAEAEAAKPFWM
ncbi:MAG TPA: DUF1127 domain-containing protein [Xanthobacteraceae bacterium]|nr:DUF1127 domain-containing protein [Xanthobacteraceae bacterium]